MKWTKKMTFYLIQMALFNSFALYKQFGGLAGAKCNFKDYHLAVTKALLNFKPEDWPYTGDSVLDENNDDPTSMNVDNGTPATHDNNGTRALEEEEEEMALDNPSPAGAGPSTFSASEEGGRRNRYVVDPPERLESKHHHTTQKIANKKRRRCRVCVKHKIRKDSCYECDTCKVALCLGSCFKQYHLNADY